MMSNIYKLREHMKLHEDPVRYVCDVCGKAFATAESLGKHCALHAPKRFACGLCDKAFSRRDYLSKHEKSHRNGHIMLEYVCFNCEEGFSNSRALEVPTYLAILSLVLILCCYFLVFISAIMSVFFALKRSCYSCLIQISYLCRYGTRNR